MVRIRLRRMGAKKNPFYRIVVADQRSPRNGRFIETVGTYNPLTDPETVKLEHDRVAHWITVGAQPSDSVARLLRTHNMLDQNNKLLPREEAEDESAEATETAGEVEAVGETETVGEVEAAGETESEAVAA